MVDVFLETIEYPSLKVQQYLGLQAYLDVILPICQWVCHLLLVFAQLFIVLLDIYALQQVTSFPLAFLRGPKHFMDPFLKFDVVKFAFVWIKSTSPIGHAFVKLRQIW